MKKIDAVGFDEKSKGTWNKSYQLISSDILWSIEPVPYIAKALEKFQRERCRTIVDIPCGDGRNTAELSKGTSFVIGVDSAVNALRIADDILLKHGLDNYVLLEGDIFKLPFYDRQVEGVLCWDVLGHLRDPASALKELNRICRKGGIVIASFFAHGDSTKGVDMEGLGNEEYLFARKFFFKFYDSEQVIKLAESVGFSVEQVELSRWTEPPHEGYREYEHEHESWVAVLKVNS